MYVPGLWKWFKQHIYCANYACRRTWHPWDHFFWNLLKNCADQCLHVCQRRCDRSSFKIPKHDNTPPYSQGRKKASTASGKIRKHFLVEKRQQDLPQISMTSASLLMRNSNSQEWSNKSLLTGLRASELHKRNRKKKNLSGGSNVLIHGHCASHHVS